MTKSNRQALLALVLTTAATSSSYGFAEFARGAVLLETSGSVTYDSYFLGTADNAPDTIYTLYPSLRYTRNAGRGTISASGGVAFNRYETNKDLDSDDLRANLSIDLPTVPGARLNGNASVSYNEATVVDLFINDRVATKTLSANFGLDYRLSDRTNLNESLNYSSSERDIYSDQDLFSNRLSFSYKGFLRGTSLIATHELALTSTSGDAFTGVGLDQQSNNFTLGLSRAVYDDITGTINYGYTVLNRSSRETTSGETRSATSYVSLSLDGPFLPRNRFPKLTSSASLSYSQSAIAGLNDNASKFLSGSLSLSWAARERTKLNIQASRSMDLSVTNLNVENTRVGGGFDQQIGQSTNVSGSVGYTWSTYRGVDRTDSRLDASLGISHTFNKYLNVGAKYTFEDNQDSSSGYQPGRFGPRSYERHTASASVNVTF